MSRRKPRKASEMYKRLAEKITKLVMTALKQEVLLDMARNGEARPKTKRLAKYSGRNSYDPEGAATIRKLKPHWLRPGTELETVVRGLLNAEVSSAHKASAQKALEAYSKKRAAEIKSTPKRVVAGVRAVVTKRRQKAAG